MEIFLQLLLATFLGAAIGLEREYKRKEAGLRTYSLVALGAAFFIIVSIEGLTTAAGLWVTAGVGVAVGAKLYFPAIFVAFIAILILSGLRLIEDKFFGKRHE